MSTAVGSITPELHFPADGERDGQGWRSELTEMRGRVLYGVSGHPEFRRPDGAFVDCDPLDAHSYHLLARFQGALVGCCRAVPLSCSKPCVAESLMGRPRLEELVLSIGGTLERTVEVSRWLVVPDYRTTVVATRLILAMWAVVRWLGARHALGMAGTRDGQDQMLLRMGGRAAPGFAPIPSQRFGQSIAAVWFDLTCPPARFATVIDEMAVRLRLPRRVEWREPQPERQGIRGPGGRPPESAFGGRQTDRRVFPTV